MVCFCVSVAETTSGRRLSIVVCAALSEYDDNAVPVWNQSGTNAITSKGSLAGVSKRGLKKMPSRRRLLLSRPPIEKLRIVIPKRTIPVTF